MDQTLNELRSFLEQLDSTLPTHVISGSEVPEEQGD
jgi:hypothetical protein